MFYLISADSNDAPLGVLLFKTLPMAKRAGDSIGYVPAYRSVDPYLIVAKDSRLGRALDELFKKNPVQEGDVPDEDEGGWSDHCIEPEDFEDNSELAEAMIEAAADPKAIGNMVGHVPDFGGCPDDD